MKVGSIGYATSRGLGHLIHDFHTHGIITDVMVVKHDRVPTNEDWYPNAPSVGIRELNQKRGMLQDFCKGMDAMLFFETPWLWDLLPWCAEQGIKTFLVPMMECTPTSHTEPYMWLCPSLLDLQYFPSSDTRKSMFLPVPTDYQWRLRERALHFVHNGGYLGLRGREGTETLIRALPHIQSPIRLTIRSQEAVSAELQRLMAADERVEYIHATIPHEELYTTGDVVVQPQKFNGMSLPLQEACASGMMVMTTDKFPMNTWLPTWCDQNYQSPLIWATKCEKARIGPAYLEFDEAVVTPQSVAAKIDQWYGKDVTALSLRGKQWGIDNSWSALGPKWVEVLQS